MAAMLMSATQAGTALYAQGAVAGHGKAHRPAATGRHAAGRCPAARYGPRSYAPGRGRTVALTFDDGPGRSTAAILAILARYRVPATFFNLGQNMAIRPWLVREEARDGYVLGNHTWDHPDMALLPAAMQRAEMDWTSARQRRLIGTVPCVFRPPDGDYSYVTLGLARHRGMSVWLWSADTEDWKADGSGAEYWAQRIIYLAEIEGGRLRHPIVLMHNQPAGNPATVSALPAIILYFRARGYRFVTL